MRYSGLKKLLALVLSLTLSLSLLPVGALASEEAAVSLLNGGMTLPPVEEEALAAEEPSVTDAAPAEETEVPAEELSGEEEPAAETVVERPVWINPIYADVVSEEDLPKAEFVTLDGAAPRFSNAEELGVYIREKMIAREEQIPFIYYGDFEPVMDVILGHTGEPKEGDSLVYQLGGWNWTDDYTAMLPLYYTNAVQESFTDAEVERLMTSLNLPRATDYETVKAVHDYLCETVTYSTTGDKTPWSTYGALVQRICVCQGYSLAVYRLLLECGIDCRIVGGTGAGGAHAWNIVKLGDYYYSLDATWDGDGGGWGDYYFLRGKTQFYKDHTPGTDAFGEDISWSSSFWDSYPMSLTDYDPNNPGGTGDDAGAEDDTSGIPINRNNFPDDIFRTYVSDYIDVSGNGYLSIAEMEAVKALDVSGLGIYELTGVSFFTELEELECYNNYLTALDVSGFINLQYLDVSGNWLDSLTLGEQKNLAYLYCENNMLPALDISGCENLIVLRCNENRLRTLDVSGCPGLVSLWCFDNLLTKLDVSGCGELIYFYCENNNLTALDVTDCSELRYFWCENNGITELDVSGCPKLIDLCCYGNSLDELDVSACSILAQLVELIDPVYDYSTLESGVVIYYYEVDDDNYCELLTDVGMMIRTRARRGDVNADGYINAADAVLVLMHTVGAGLLAGDAALEADVNFDEVIDARDAAQILRYENGLTSAIE